MKWMKRCLWIAAWGFWLWLGFGLHRELPRNYGPTTASIRLNSGYRTLGFIGSSNQAAFVVPIAPNRSSIHVIDGETGAEVQQVAGPFANDYLLWEEHYPRSHGVLLSNHSPVVGTEAATVGLHLLDLERGGWKKLSDRDVLGARLHPKKPWAVLVDSNDMPNRTWRVTLIDYQAGRRVIVRDHLPPLSPSHLAFFLQNPDRVVVPLPKHPAVAGHEVDLEIWMLGESPKLERTIAAPGFSEPFIVAENARVAFSDVGGWDCVDVMDCNEGRLVFSHPPRHERDQKKSRSMYAPHLSGSGRTVLAGRPLSLWDVDSGLPIRSGSRLDSFNHICDDRRFTTSELWWRLWPKWSKQFPLSSSTYRSLADGELLFRTTEKAHLVPTWWNAAGTLAIDPTGNRIVSMPPRVNYPLLALCQTILALPLLLLWAILRWRRNRKLRLAGVQP